MSEISSIGQKLAEQASQNAQQEAGKPDQGDVAQFQEAMNSPQKAQDPQAVRLPGPAEVQSVSSTYATQANGVIGSSTESIHSAISSTSSLPSEANQISQDALSRIQETQKTIDAIGQDPSLSPAQASEKIQDSANGLVKYLQDTISQFQGMQASLNDKLANVGPNMSQTELIKLQQSMNDVTFMSSAFAKVASNITNGIKTILQQQ